MTYQRFWDLHVTASNGWYDFAQLLGRFAIHQYTRHPDTMRKTRIAIEPGISPVPCIVHPQPIGGLPPTGYVSTVVRTTELQTLTATDEFGRLLSWVNEPGQRGKLRFSAHGDGGGHLGMRDGAGNFEKVHASTLSAWLSANGLSPGARTRPFSGPRQEGLVLITFMVCMAGRSHDTPAQPRLFGEGTAAAPTSLIREFATSLRGRRIRGIEVTGSNDVLVVSKSVKLGSDSYRDVGRPPTGGEWKADGDLSVQVPNGWNVRPKLLRSSGGAIDIPAQYQITPLTPNVRRDPSSGWALTIPGKAEQNVEVKVGWLVDLGRRCITPPLGWRLSSDGTNRGGRAWYESASPVHMVGELSLERFAHSRYKVREYT